MTLQIIGLAKDKKTNTPVIYCQVSVSEYLNLVGKDFENFSIQRRRENHKAYRRLKQDIQQGGLIPPITLSVKPELVDRFLPHVDSDHSRLKELMSAPSQVDILDGLQRTYIMSDLSEEGHVFPEDQKIILEFWLENDLNKLIYRIIVLNAGQKPMSIRHQIELLFMSLKASIELKINDLQIYTERDQTRRRRSRKFPLNYIVSAYQAYLTGSPELRKDNLIAQKMEVDNALDSSEETISTQFDRFVHYLSIYSELDDEVFRIYNTGSLEGVPDPIDSSSSANEEKKPSASVHWLSTENVFIGFFAAISQFLDTEDVEASRMKEERLGEALEKLLSRARAAEIGDDPFHLAVFDPIRLGANPRKVNVGTATRRLILTGFKEFFRDGGDMSMGRAWQLAAD